MNRFFTRSRLLGSAAAAVAALLAGCASPPPPAPEVKPPPPAAVVRPAPPPPVAAPALPPPGNQSAAATPKDYRKDAAKHLYGINRDRIYKGRMPPLLYAVGVIQFDVDGRGQVSNVNWMRAPKHAPEVMAEIEKMIRTAAPYPAPTKMGRVSYTDTWLWHKSGRFQLDTLTEGQD